MGSLTARQATSYALALVPAGLLPAMVGLAGPFYFAGALRAGHGLSGRGRRGSGPAFRTRRPAGCCGRRSSTLPAVLLLLVLNPMPA